MTTIVERRSWTSIWKKWRSGSTGRSTATSEEAENTFKLWTFSQWRRWWWSFLPTQHHFTHHHQHIPRIHIRCRRRATFNVHQRWTEDLRVPVSADKSQATMQDLTNDDFEMPEHVRLCNYKSDCNVQTNRSTMNRTCIMCGQMRPYKKAGIWIPH